MEKNRILKELFPENYFQSMEKLLELCTHKQQVKFALFCAENLEKFYDKNKYTKIYIVRQRILKLVKVWLKHKNSVTRKQFEREITTVIKEMQKATNAAAYSAANAAVNAAYAASDAAYAAANAAANAANAAAYAATNAEASSSSENNYWLLQQKYKLYHFELIKFITLDKGYNIAALEILYGQA